MCKVTDDRTVLSVLQEPLEFVSRPFASYAEALGCDEERVLARIRDYLIHGVIRRFAGIVHHNLVGYRCNAMVAFEVDKSACDNAGAILSRFSFITHCYRRKAFPDWPYNLYAMVHAHDSNELEKHLEKMKNCFTYSSLAVLQSVKEFKKKQFRIPAVQAKVNHNVIPTR